ncbi:phosphotransferase enzyme family protein [Alicyclobacillus sp. ALC3]|uniref:phosphotransferase enzyme family protein n=1 Tax=Alicyclobacillus sp. ALC3 TaxID=2796143 RepID=UPI0023799567|nr:phosphotransferase [Alicyclobacillus sp. ALC3]WDL96685.1 phosphotransferase [Alicyclobacillus sp. ALC3]
MEQIPEQVIRQASDFFGCLGPLRLMESSYNNVFEAYQDHHPVILKIMPRTIADVDAIMSELEWVRFLGSRGLKVCSPTLSRQGQFVENIVSGDLMYHALCFEKSQGVSVGPKGPNWNQNLFRTWGAAMGTMHAAATQFRPSHPAIRRPYWYEYALFNNLNDFPKSGGEMVRKKWIDAAEWLHSLPTPPGAFGLIHNDLHHYNFHVLDQGLVLFDFGDCEYGWFSYDIAISAYHAVQTVSLEDRTTFAKQFISAFLEGYLSRHNLEPEWIQLIPKFIEYRRLFSLVFFLHHAGTFGVDDDTWKAIMTMKAEVERDEPYIKC